MIETTFMYITDDKLFCFYDHENDIKYYLDCHCVILHGNKIVLLTQEEWFANHRNYNFIGSASLIKYEDIPNKLIYYYNRDNPDMYVCNEIFKHYTKRTKIADTYNHDKFICREGIDCFEEIKKYGFIKGIIL